MSELIPNTPNEPQRNFYDYAFLSAFTNIPLDGKNPKKFFDETINGTDSDDKTGIFKPYKTFVNKKMNEYNDPNQNDKNLNDELYNPIAYTLFHEFDLAVFSLIDDFGFASRRFKPNKNSSNFKYQINTGVIPLIGNEGNNTGEESFQQKIKNLFIEDKIQYPFTGITTLKLNNAMLVGIGDDFIKLINQVIICLVDKFIKDSAIDEKLETGLKNIFYIINENLGWNEITIHFFSKTTEAIRNIIFKIRHLSLGSIESEIDRLENDAEKSKLKGILKNVKEKSLLFKLIEFENNQQSVTNIDITTSHPIIATSTIYGIDIKLYDDEKLKTFQENEFKEVAKVIKIDNYEKVLKSCFFVEKVKRQINITWNIKPGHEKIFHNQINASKSNGIFKSVLDETEQDSITEITNKLGITDLELKLNVEKILIKNYYEVDLKTNNNTQFLNGDEKRYINKQEKYKIKAGKFSIIYPDCRISLADYLKFVDNLTMNEGLKLTKLKKNIVKFKSDIVSKDEEFYNNKNNLDIKSHYDYSCFENFKIKDFEKIIERIKKYPLSNLIEEELENIIINFNEAISDPLIYNYFIGMKASIEELMKKFKVVLDSNKKKKDTGKNQLFSRDYSESIHMNNESPIDIKSVSIKHDDFLNFIALWDQAYWNRYFHSYYFTELNDFNIEHHGGVQQILFSYDTAYKIACESFYGTTFQFATVVSDPYVKSVKFGVKLNLVHLFSPIIFATEWIHEAANHYLQYLATDEVKAKKATSNEKNIINFLKAQIPSENGSISRTEINKFNTFISEVKANLFMDDYYTSQIFDKYFANNLIRYIITDYMTWFHTYKKDKIEEEDDSYQGLVMFYFSHWLTSLSRTDFYETLNMDEAEWTFKKDSFEFIFIRFNLMMYLMNPSDESCPKEMLKNINKFCPSVALERHWERISELLDFVYQLGDSMKEVIKELNPVPESKDEKSDFFEDLKSFCEIKSPTKEFTELIAENKNIIEYYREKFKFYNKDDNKKRQIQYNTLIRKFKEGDNISFHASEIRKDILLDPRGYMFIMNKEIRNEILKLNIKYMKKIYDISQKWILKKYTELL